MSGLRIKSWRWLVSVIVCTVAFGQSVPKAREFEVVSVKRAERFTPKELASGSVHLGLKISGERVEIGFVSLNALIAMAYEVEPSQVLMNGRDDGQHFDIVANLPHGATSEEVPEMLQHMLVLRFGLVARRDERIQQAYALRIAAGGPGLRPAETETESPTIEPNPFDGNRYASDGSQVSTSVVGGRQAVVITGGKAGPIRITKSAGVTRIDARAITLSELARVLSSVVGAIVVDLSETKGAYQIDLEIPDETTDPSTRQGGASLDASGSFGRASDVSVLNKSLRRSGLRLGLERLPVEVIFVEHCNPSPTAN